MATAPQAATEMPQQGANPFADPNTMAVYEQMRQTVSPKEFGDQMLAGASQSAPEEVAAFRAALEQVDLPPEALDLLNNMVDEILANPEKYAEIRAKYKEMGAPDDILPEQFDPQFFAALNMAVDQMIGEPAGVQAFAEGGIAELSPVAKAIASYGRNGDTMLAHITPAEARMLRRKGGSGTINPVTGLPEFFLGSLFKGIGKALKSIGNAVKSFANSTVGRIVTTVALGFFLGPAAATFMGATSTAAVAAVSGFVGSAGSTLLGGGSISQALKAGAMGGLTAGVGAGVMGGADAFTAGSYTGPTTIGGQFDKFTGAISPTAAPAAPTDVLRDNVTTSTARDAYSTELAKTNPEVFNNPNAAPAGESPFAAKKITLGGGPAEQITMPNGAVVTQNAANPFAPTSTNYGAFGEAPLNASAQTAAVGNTVAPPINAQPPAMASAATGNAIAPAIGNPVDATQFPGSFDKTGIMSTQEPSFFDKAKGFFDKNISPSGIQQQGVPAAEQAGLAARDAMLARTPTATPAMLEGAYQNAYKAAMPGALSTYGPMTALGIGAIGAFGGFSPKAAPVSPYQSLLTGGPGSARDLMNKNPNRFYVQNLPGVNYYNGSVLKPTGMATGGLADIAKMGRDGDTMLAHINPAEAQMLKRMGGRGTINPKTGLPEFAFGDDDFLRVNQDYGSGYNDVNTSGSGDRYRVDISGGAGYADIPQYVNDFYTTPGTVLATTDQVAAGVGTWNPAANAWEIAAPMAGSLDAGPVGNTIGNTPFTAADLATLTGGTTSTVVDAPYTPLTVGGQILTADQVAGAADTLTVSPNNVNNLSGLTSLNGGIGSLVVGDATGTPTTGTPTSGTPTTTTGTPTTTTTTGTPTTITGTTTDTATDTTTGTPTTTTGTPTTTTGTPTTTTGTPTTTTGTPTTTTGTPTTIIDTPITTTPITTTPTTGTGTITTCPAPEMRILLANGDLKAAGDLQVGDVVKTQHENTLAWGEHPVTHVAIVPDALRLKFSFDDGEFIGSTDHKFFKAANEWVTAKDVVPGDMLSGKTVRSIEETATGDVVRITIDDAHTYICEGLLSHNKSPLPDDTEDPVVPPVVPPVVEPPYVPPVVPPVVLPYVPPIVPREVVDPPYVAPTVPVVPVRTPGTASIDPRVAGVPGGSYMFTRNTPTFPTGSLSRTMSPYTGGITELMPKMVAPTQVPTQMQRMPVATPATVGIPPVSNTPEDMYHFGIGPDGVDGRGRKMFNMGGIAGLAQGGYPRRTGQISGPGTATSDSIPAMLSDGEFVMTAKAVRGAGKGDRRAGAKRMYALMNQLEKNAARG